MLEIWRCRCSVGELLEEDMGTIKKIECARNFDIKRSLEAYIELLSRVEANSKAERLGWKTASWFF